MSTKKWTVMISLSYESDAYLTKGREKKIKKISLKNFNSMIFEAKKNPSPIQIIISRNFSGSRDPHNNVCTIICHLPAAIVSTYSN